MMYLHFKSSVISTSIRKSLRRQYIIYNVYKIQTNFLLNVPPSVNTMFIKLLTLGRKVCTLYFTFILGKRLKSTCNSVSLVWLSANADDWSILCNDCRWSNEANVFLAAGALESKSTSYLRKATLSDLNMWT